MKILALETATPICSVALGIDGIHHILSEEGRGIHSEAMFRMTEDLLSRFSLGIPDLDAVLISRGPGQYTGLRIAASGVKGFLFGQQVPLWSIGTLEGFAAGLMAGERKKGQVIHAVLDARRSHLYHQRFVGTEGGWDRSVPAVRSLKELNEEIESRSWIVGTGMDRLDLSESGTPRKVSPDMISAGTILRAWQDESLNNWFRKEDPVRFEPEYLGSGAPRKSG
ncbi:MAG: tRNA (adenosine(37)-N6)-threonylcarbamoyltransferase complex dimerization subunit type 1 TsaB [Balneolaceae bacterium]